MQDRIRVVALTPDNPPESGCPCFLDPEHASARKNPAWYSARFSEGLTLKHLFLEGEPKPAGFIEYVPGEYAWRAVDAEGYLFIHCIWVYPKKNRQKGIGSILLEECIRDAEALGKVGVASITSDGPFIMRKDLFLKNGFSIIDRSGGYELVAKRLKDGPLPKFLDWKSQLTRYKGLHLIYTDQCPWVARSIPELKDIARLFGIEMTITELKTPEEAHRAPSVCATLSLVYDGTLLADHFIPGSRFFTILKKIHKIGSQDSLDHTFDLAKEWGVRE
jgi:hypothetical protein